MTKNGAAGNRKKFSLGFEISPLYTVIALLSSAFLAFGVYNVHSISGVTEGGSIGLTLLLQYWFDISPAVSSFIFNIICYGIGWKLLGKSFLYYSFVASVGYSVAYKILEQFDPVWPQLADMPRAACLIGAVFVGVGAGMCVKVGGAQCGDDALAMSISKLTHVEIQWVYLISDLSVLLLSLSYIPVRRIAYSLVTVILSGQLIGVIQRIPMPFLEKKLDKKL